MDNNISINNIKQIIELHYEIKYKNIMSFYNFLFDGFEDNMSFDACDYTPLSNRDSSPRELSGSKRNKVVEFLKEGKILKNLQSTLENTILKHNEKLKEVSDDFLKIFEKSFKEPSPIYTRIESIFEKPQNYIALAVAIKWLIVDSITIKHITEFEQYYNEDFKNYNIVKDNIDEDINKILNDNKIFLYAKSDGSLFAEIPFSDYPELFYEIRRKLIEKENDELIISGETLMDAFNYGQNAPASIIDSIKKSIAQGTKRIKIYLADPDALDDDIPVQKALKDLEFSLTMLADNLFVYLSNNCNCKLDIYFLPSLSIDHVVKSKNWMIYRSTKLWTKDRDCKGSVYIYDLQKVKHNFNGDVAAQIKYFEYIEANSIEIDIARVITEKGAGRALHELLRYKLRDIDPKCNNIKLHKIYESQLRRYALSSFNDAYGLYANIKNNTPINNNEELFNFYNSKALDKTQNTLLSYIKTTTEMMNNVVKQYDRRPQSGAIIIPSADLGYPNNIQRLAGGFATGMFIDWECGTPLVPIDATVNVCSSSVFRVSIPEELLHNLSINFVNTLEGKLNEITKETGYSFSFTSGNHFLMIAKDDEDEYYLVLHSSARELKDSYLGLYPSENNWYSSKVKTYIYPDAEGRYLRYINGGEALQFINMAHNIEEYNVEIHKKVAKELNGGVEPSQNESIIKHHYYMPTDSSIAIGTFVEQLGEIVPMFSDVFKKVYLFKIGENNLTYNLGEKKGRCCIIPHGWGQEINNINNIYVDPINQTLSLDNVKYGINSRIRLDDRVNKNIRQFKDGEVFLKKCKTLDGEFIKVLTPKFLYCRKHKGIVEEDK